MSLKMKCPACGMTARIAEPVVEQTLMCTGCGSSLHVRGRDDLKDFAGQSDGDWPDAAVGAASVKSYEDESAVDGWVSGASGAVTVAAILAVVILLVALWIADMRRHAGISEGGNVARASAMTSPPTSRPIASPTVVTALPDAATSQLPPPSDVVIRPIRPIRTRPIIRPALIPVSGGSSGTAAASPDIAPTVTPQPVPQLPIVDRQRPALRPASDNSGALTDKQIGDAIASGVNWMVNQFDPNRHELRLQLGDRSPFHGGMDALCVYALMQSGEAVGDPRLSIHGPFMKGCIDLVKQFPNEDHHSTYARGIRATALALYNRKEDHDALRADVKWLLEAAHDGAYTYTKVKNAPGPPGQRGGPFPFDNSNSQYGLLGVWSGAEAEVEVPLAYWQAVEAHWTGCQAKNGQWAYGGGRPEAGTISMTAAGVASLFVTHDWLDAPRFGANVGRDPFSPPLKRGLDWFEQGDNAVNVNGGWWGYTLYGVERVGLASGFKYFGSHDWYRELAAKILQAQGPDGSWDNGNPVETAYCLLFLSRGRHPILMNKLRFDGYWANRPRDLANLARYTSRQLERAVNWQVVPLARPWTDWTDSPIVYLASHQAPHISEQDVQNLRAFVMAGGMLFTQADGDSPEFNRFAIELAHRLFPTYEMTDLPANHSIFSVLYKVSPHPPLKMVSNGARVLMLHAPIDISKVWQLREQKLHKAPFELGVNLFIYAAGKRDLRNRLESNYLDAPTAAPLQSVRVARVQYAGNWDPEPYAWTRFARSFGRQTGYGLEPVSVPMSRLDATQTPLAHLTGTARYSPTAEEVTAIRAYVESGGVLFVDLCGGTGPFDESVRTQLFASAFPDARPRVMGFTHPLLLAAGQPGMQDLSHPRLRPFAVEVLGSGGGYLSGFAAGKGHVLFTSFDVTCGLLGTNTWGIIGYEPAYAESLMRNLIFWTIDGQKDE